MILSVCPNPCIDLTVELEQLNVGQLNRVENKVMTYSGKALNTSIGVARLGGDSYATGFMYYNDGSLFSQRLDNEGVKNTFVWNKGSLRINYKIVDNRSMLTEINDRGEPVPEEKQRELLDLVGTLSKKASVVVISGSLPKGVSDDYYLKLRRTVNPSSKVIIDTEGDKLVSAIQDGVFLVKPNLVELENIVKKRLTNFRDMIESSKFLLKAGAENVVLSLGKDGAILTDHESSYYCKSVHVAVNSTVGAGDSMVAAISVMAERGGSKEDILRAGVAAGAASITTPGTNLFYRDKFEEIYSKVYVEKL